MSFLPTNYEVPNVSNYMKLDTGANKFRVMGSAVVGMMYWKTVDGQRKPQRKHMGEPIPAQDIEVNPKSGEPEKIKHFWAFAVWNYKAEKIQILEITQKTIMNQIKAYTENEDWGDPKNFDLTITKSGEGLETEYSVIASPHKKCDPKAVQEMKNTPINLEALFRGDDPFLVDSVVQDVSDNVADDAFNALTEAK